MKKLGMVLFVTILFTGMVNGQSAISIGGNVALPIGDWADFANIGFGGTASYEHQFNRNLTGTATAGYLIWGGKEDIPDFKYDYSAIPVLAGVKYFFVPGQGFYVAGQAGFHFFSVDVESTVPGFQFSSSGSETEFSAAAGLGYEVPAGSKGAIDISAMFNLISDLNYIGFRIAYKFGLN